MKNTITVIDWFKNAAYKKQCSFIQFHVENVYKSLSLNLFNEAIQYARTIRKYMTVIKLSSNIQQKLCSFITTNPKKRNLETQILMYLWVVMMEQRFVN